MTLIEAFVFKQKTKAKNNAIVKYDKKKEKFVAILENIKLTVDPILLPVETFYDLLNEKEKPFRIEGANRELNWEGFEIKLQKSCMYSIIKIENVYKKKAIIDLFFNIKGMRKGHIIYVPFPDRREIKDMYIEVPLSFIDETDLSPEDFIIRF